MPIVDGQIAQLHCHYRVIGRRETAAVIQRRLDRLAQEQVLAAFAEALAEVLGDDPTVYIFRRLESKLAFNLADEPTDDQLARRWGGRLAGAVIRHLARSTGRASDLIKFANQAEYVANFSADLLAGRAWDCWFYWPLAAYKGGSSGETLQNVLLANREHIPDTLRYLHQAGMLEKFLISLGPAALRAVWAEGLGTAADSSSETVRPLFAKVLELVDRLELWGGAIPRRETLFLGYLATRPPPVDWRDGRGLALAAGYILQFLEQQGYLRPPEGLAAIFQGRLDLVLQGFDWLDTAHLRAVVLDLFKDSTGVQAELPVRHPGQGPTPRQRALLAELLALVKAGEVRLDQSRPDSVENALRLYAALVARAPQWSGDSLATGFIRDLLAAWTALLRSRSAAATLSSLRQGDIEGALESLPAPARARAAAPFKSLAGLGDIGLDLVSLLSGPAQLQTGLTQEEMPAELALDLTSGCAGLFLLLRAVLDARLPALVKQANYPPQGKLTPSSAILLALGLRWAGAGGIVEGLIDPGLGLFAGLPRAPTLDNLRDSWSLATPKDHLAFQADLLHLLAGQRLVKGARLHLYYISLADDRMALIAGDEAGAIWPLGQILADKRQIRSILPDWLTLWADTTGYKPLVVLDNGLAALAPDTLPGAESVVIVNSDEISGEPGSAPAANHRAGRVNLLTALTALEQGYLGLPETDLTVALTAIALLRLWARWLQQFAASSTPYLLENFIRRAGRILMDEQRILVELDSLPLDVVIELAGYTAPLERVTWLDDRNVEYQIRGIS